MKTSVPRSCLYAVLVTACQLGAASIVLASPITIDVNCNGNKVGTITAASDDSGIVADFKSSVGGPPPTLKAAATACDEDHFNWYQVRVGGDPPGTDAHGKTPTIPFVDPPPDGWNYLWADRLPWYWNESSPADGKNPDGTTFSDVYLLKNQTTADTLHFEDFPAGGDKSFYTWLVSLDANGMFDSWHGGFSWDYSSTANSVSNILKLNSDPTDAQYKDITGGFAVPEPSSLTLMTLGLASSWRFRRRLYRSGRAA